MEPLNNSSAAGWQVFCPHPAVVDLIRGSQDILILFFKLGALAESTRPSTLMVKESPFIIPDTCKLIFISFTIYIGVFYYIFAWVFILYSIKTTKTQLTLSLKCQYFPNIRIFDVHNNSAEIFSVLFQNREIQYSSVFGTFGYGKGACRFNHSFPKN